MLDPAPYRPGAEVHTLKAGQPIKLHPMIDDIDFLYIHPVQSKTPDARLEIWEEDGDPVAGNAYSGPAVDELATSPPCSRMVVRIDGELAANITNPQGVTVRDLLDGVAGYWNKPVGEEAARYYRRLWLYGYFDGEVKVGDFLPKNHHWEGWTRPEVQEDGSVLLECTEIRGA